MNALLAMIKAIGVSFGDTLLQYRDPALVSCALVLIVVALTYLMSSSVRMTIENTLAMKRPSGFKRLFGGLLILLPGIIILASTYFTQLTRAVEQRWPGLARQYIARNETQITERHRQMASRRKPRNPAPIEPSPTPPPRAHEDRTAVESIGNHEPQESTSWPTLESYSDSEAELKRKQAARRKLVERRLREDQRRRKRNANVWLTKSGELAAVSEADLDEAVRYLEDRNVEAFHRLEATQRVFYFKDRERVSIIRYEYTTGKVKIRLLSTNMELWTFRKSLTKENR